ncbi:MAG: cytochrome c-type biogenesis protein CcmH [Rhodospirillaceae bacterium]
MIKPLLMVLGILFFSQTAAVEPDEVLDDPVMEARARAISKDLRCVVCQNETIDESHATLAKDMRRLVRQRVNAGDTKEQVLSYMVNRYGDFVLLRPRVNAQTALLWFGPAIIMLFGSFVVVRVMRKSKRGETENLSTKEQRRLEQLLSENREV